jgi:hypothetical protein
MSGGRSILCPYRHWVTVDTGARNSIHLCRKEQPEMNLRENPTLEQFRALLASRDDSDYAYVLWVDSDGEVFLTPMQGTVPAMWESYQTTLKFRFESFAAGTGYVGPEAAEDDEWVNRLYAALHREWQADRRGHLVDIF